MTEPALTAPLVALTGGGPHAWIMINALRARFGPFPVIREAGEPAGVFWRRRLKRLGAVTVASQLAAKLPIKLVKPLSRRRIAELIATHGLHPDPDPSQAILNVPSVNSQACHEALATLAPKAVFVVSTRMISQKTLDAIRAPFINYHSGINPAYRGINGGYFALARGQGEHFGTTVHLVDRGVDTGDILYQTRVPVSPHDNFHTYLWTLAAHSRDALVRAMEDALADRLRSVRVDLPSRQWFAPGLGFYLWAGVMRGVW